MTDPVALLEKLSDAAPAPRHEFRAALHDLLAQEAAVPTGAVAVLRRRRTAVLGVAACLAALAVLLTRSPTSDPNGLEVVDQPVAPTPTAMSFHPVPGGLPRAPSLSSGDTRAEPADPVPANTSSQTVRSPRLADAPPVQAPVAGEWLPDRYAYADQADDAYPPYSASKTPDATLSDDATDIVHITVGGLERRMFTIELGLAAAPRDATNYWVSAYLDPAHECWVYYYLDPGRAADFDVFCGPLSNEQVGSGFGVGTVTVDGTMIRATFAHPDTDDTPTAINNGDTFYGFNARTCAGASRNCTNANTFDEAKSPPGVRFRWR